MLGLGQEQLGSFTEARKSYEQVIGMLSGDGRNSKLFASVLSNLGDLYRDLGQFEEATTLQIKALHIYEGLSDSAGIVRTYSDLGGIEFSQRHIGKGRKYLKCASNQLKNAVLLDEDDRAILCEPRGWQQELDGNSAQALEEYKQALNLWGHAHGAGRSYSEWGHFLLGKAYYELGEIETAGNEFRDGLSILREAYGPDNVRYLTEMSYSRYLNLIGDKYHAE